MIAVWAYNFGSFDKRRTYFDPLTVPRHRHGFLHAQDGLFLYVAKNRADRHFKQHGEWPSFEQIMEENHDPKYPTVFRCLTLPGDKVEELQVQLVRRRLTVAHLMPTLDNVTEALKQRWSFPQSKWRVSPRGK
jgi:hypothetical protein